MNSPMFLALDNKGIDKTKSNFEYKGYYTKIEFDADAMLLHGKIEGISDLVTFESQDASQIKNEIHATVDDYLAFCEENGKRPEEEYRGLFNVRLQPKLHKRISAEAMKRDMTVNAAVEQAIQLHVGHTSSNCSI